eukprot:10196533-Alexandrium_andersonii.AAC.1
MAAPALFVERRWGPDLAQAVYLDDRTGFTATLEQLREALALWRRFEAASGLPTNAAKTQLWGRTPAAHRALLGDPDLSPHVTAHP